MSGPVRVPWSEFHADPRAVARRTRDDDCVVVHDDDGETLFVIVRQRDEITD